MKKHFGLTLFFFSMLLPSFSYAQEIGLSEVSVNTVSQIRNGKTISLPEGGKLFFQSEIVTGEESVNVDLFNDGTKLSIGPNARVMLDSFTYNPTNTTGKLAISLSKGSLRWVSGKLSSDSYKVSTPIAGVGIRGTSFVLNHTASSGTEIIVEDGQVEFSNLARTSSVTLAKNMAGRVANADADPESFNTATPTQKAIVATLNTVLATVSAPSKSLAQTIKGLSLQPANATATAAEISPMETGSSDFGGDGRY